VIGPGRLRRRLPRTTAVQTTVVDQDEQRVRRRQRRPVHYTRFNLVREIHDIITAPLAARVAAEPAPGAYWAQVNELVDATHAAVLTIGDMLAEVDAQRRTGHLPVDQRGQAIKLLLDLAKAEHPVRPDIDRGELVSGTWPEVLVDHCRPVAGRLSDLLERAKPPGALRGALSASERLEGALREIDRAAMSLERGLDAAARNRAERQGGRSGPSESDRARAALATMGVKL
jgi:hypothetical protein